MHFSHTFHMHFSHALFTHTFYKNFSHALFTCTFYMHFLHSLFIHTFCTHFLHALFTRTFPLELVEPTGASGRLLASELATACKPSASILFYWREPCGRNMELVVQLELVEPNGVGMKTGVKSGCKR